ncbi:hypothetical protein V5O48_011472 [Marasmius crinis-equi]|uniref:F-box domain-containing protein n=1 Tax=Marasmius crinis-equi TaxID=585013 RepID=A0ABR3F5M9_9AGAR
MTPLHPPSPATENLATSNEPPLNSFQSLSDNLAQTKARLDIVSDRIEIMEDNLRVLHEERDRLTGFVATYKQILHPIRRLPENVLREIFRASTENGSGAMELYARQKGMVSVMDSLCPTNAPWTLSQVSRRWREVAVSYSSLWAFVAITFPGPQSTQPFLAGMGAQLSRQLRRSGSSTLTVALYSNHLLEATDPFLMTISSHSDRWSALRIDFPPKDLQTLGGFIRGAIPNLRKLYLRHPDSALFHPPDLEEMKAFEIAPKLFDFTISTQKSLALHLPIPWPQITRLRTIADCKATDKYSYHQKVPNLDAYYVHVSRPTTRNPAAFTTSFSLLTVHFSTTDTKCENGEFLLVNLNPTHLRDLRINAPVAKSLRIEIPASVGETLRNLCLRMDSLTSIEVATVFPSLPALESLSLCNVQGEVLSDLASLDITTGMMQFLPRLRDIGFYATKIKACHEPSLLRLLDNRFRHHPGSKAPTSTGKPLQNLRIHRNIPLQEATLHELEIMTSEGLQVDTSPADWIHFFPGF